MNKYLVIGIVALSLMTTTVYSINNSNNLVNKSTTYNQNCPYHDRTTNTHSCPNNGIRGSQYNHCSNGNTYHRHSEYHHNR